jgi:hypothetical protein
MAASSPDLAELTRVLRDFETQFPASRRIKRMYAQSATEYDAVPELRQLANKVGVPLHENCYLTEGRVLMEFADGHIEWLELK